MDLKQKALSILKAGIEAVDPYKAVKKFVALDGDILKVADKEYDLEKIRRVLVVGAGKASAAMALGIEEILGARLDRGLVVVKYGHVADTKKIQLVEAGHPVPDAAGVGGARKILELADSAWEHDLVICLLSGGGSALLVQPVSGVSLDDLAALTGLLLRCGADIGELNCIRKHLSQIKGGNLLRRAAPARVVSLILSDVVGDRLDVIASAPTTFDSTTFADALAILEKYDLVSKAPKSVVEHLKRGVSGLIPDTPKPHDPILKLTQNVIIGSNIIALRAAAEKAVELGYRTLILTSSIEGETSESARFHIAIASEIIATGNPLPAPCCILSGGETTVTIKGSGLGGRNQEFGLVSAIGIQGLKGLVIGSVGTDGTDGPTDAAGAVVDGETVAGASALGRNAASYLANNDSYNFFKSMPEHVITGPTNTNVIDIRIILADK